MTVQETAKRHRDPDVGFGPVFERIAQRDDAERERIKAGLQCPECFGPQVKTRRQRGHDRVDGFLCTNCGCQWGSR